MNDICGYQHREAEVNKGIKTENKDDLCFNVDLIISDPKLAI